MEQLTDSQKKAVLHHDGPLLVLAGPGSGKTRVITSRIAELINSGVRPYNICAITFTNKAAEEMRQRVSANANAADVHISTFHSLCVRILRRYAEQAKISSNFSIYDQDDQVRCVKLAIKQSNVDASNFTPSKMLNAISQLKNDMETPQAVQDRAYDYFSKTLAKIYTSYQRILEQNNALDFDDLLVRTAFLLRDKPDVRSELSRRYRYLLVDEYQDTNHAQYQIARGLALDHGNICVTGDPDQSIYRWRGADIANILIFEEDWPSAVVVKLEENFRSTPNILTLADKLISANTKRKEKVLIATRPTGSEVEICGFADDTTESENVADNIRRLLDEGADLNDIAIFYRVNAMSRTLEEALVRKQIPYQVVRGVEFYGRKEIRDMLSYLKLMANPDDNIAFQRAVGTHPRGIGKTTLERLAAFARYNNLCLYEAARHIESVDSIAKAARGRIAAFIHMIEQLKQDLGGEVAPLMDRVFAETGLMDHLKKNSARGSEAIENISELINSAARYDDSAEEPSLLDWLQTIALYSDTDAYDKQSGKVSLMSLHAAKGLEFANVFVVGLEEGILPHERSAGTDEELEEERRLFFVGITRARDNLTVSYAKHRTFRGQFLRTVPSQFLYEIGYDASEYQTGLNYEPFEDDGIAFTKTRTETVPGDPAAQAGKFVPGELVEHKKFGLGRIKEFLDLGEKSIVVVRFNSGKTKSLMVQYAKLKKITI